MFIFVKISMSVSTYTLMAYNMTERRPAGCLVMGSQLAAQRRILTAKIQMLCPFRRLMGSRLAGQGRMRSRAVNNMQFRNCLGSRKRRHARVVYTDANPPCSPLLGHRI